MFCVDLGNWNNNKWQKPWTSFLPFVFLSFLLELENQKTKVRRKHWTTFPPFSFLLFCLELKNWKTIKWHRHLSMTPPSSFHPSAIPCGNREPENVTLGLSLFYTFNFLLLTSDFWNRKKHISSLFQLLFSDFRLPPYPSGFQGEKM